MTRVGPLIPGMMNDPKDRHVLAAAVHCQADVIVTFNLRHFRHEHLGSWGIQALHPQTFLASLLRQNEQIVLNKLSQQAMDRGRTIERLLSILNTSVPNFVALVSTRITTA